MEDPQRRIREYKTLCAALPNPMVIVGEDGVILLTSKSVEKEIGYKAEEIVGKKIYGIDLEKKVTALMVKDAIVECFYQAHCEDSGLAKDKDVNKSYCKSIIKKRLQIQGEILINQPKKIF